MLIDYKNVEVCQEAQIVLNDVTLQVDKGEFVYIIGKVGSGKSSLLKTFYGEVPVKKGEGTVMGFDVTRLKSKRLPQLRRKLGIIFQDFQLLTDRNVSDNLRFVLNATGWKNKLEIDNRIKEVLNLVGMTTKGYKLPSELSGGEQQRIAIARAILNNPELILADEPTGNLDLETGRAITRLLHDISKSGSAVVMITHNLQLLNEFPGKVFICENHTFKERTGKDVKESEVKGHDVSDTNYNPSTESGKLFNDNIVIETNSHDA